MTEQEPQFTPQEMGQDTAETNITLLRHSTPDYMDMIVGKTFDELAKMDEQGQIAHSGVKYPEGYDLALDIGKSLKEREIIPDLIVTGPLERAKETAILVAGELTKDRSQHIDTKGNKPTGIPTTVIEEFTELEPGPKDYNAAREKLQSEGSLENSNKLSSAKEAGMYYQAALKHWFENNRNGIEERVDATIAKIKEFAQENQASNALIISHGCNLGAIYAKLNNRDIDSVLEQTQFSPGQGFQLGINIESGVINIK